MAISNVWTDVDTLEATTSAEARAANFNAALGNVLFLGNPPTVQVKLTANQEVADATNHIVEWDQASWDSTRTDANDVTENGDMFDLSSTKVLVAPRAGRYLIIPSIQWDGTSDDNSTRSVSIILNGTTPLARNTILSPSAPEQQAAIETRLGINDYIEIEVRQLSGAALDMTSTRTRCTFTWLGLSPSEFST